MTLFCGLLTASCTQSLEQIVQERRQQRMENANAELSLGQGATDGLGSYMIAHNQPQIPTPEDSTTP
jgi:hypothetical protein